MRKSTGIVCKVDERGGGVLPVQLRRLFRIEEHGAIEIYIDGDTIILRKYSPACVFCGADNELHGGRVETFRGKPVCHECRKSMAGQAG